MESPYRSSVLYKNGVGYFEHLGKVRGNQSLSIDFTSAQLDDALKSLTALDLGNGRVSGISYNSEAPLGQRLGALRLPLSDRTTTSLSSPPRRRPWRSWLRLPSNRARPPQSG